MILFDLLCTGGHVFEAWFRSSGDYDSQQARGLIACPTCGNARVTKAVMAPNIGAKGNRGGVSPPAAPPSTPDNAAAVPMMSGDAPALPPAMQAMLAAIAKSQAEALPRSTWVGDRFASEARAIHDRSARNGGDGEQAAPGAVIHGRATPDEAEALIDDGIMVMPLLVPVVPPQARN